MQIGSAAYDTDQKQGNTMNINPNRGGSHMKKTMRAIIRTSLVAILVTLGLVLEAWAAEPAKAELRKGNDAAGAADVPRLAPVESEPVDIGRWAYVYRQGAKDNPWETRWLDPNDKMLCGFLWEEAVEIARVEVELPAGSAWSADDLQVMAGPTSRVYGNPWCMAIDWLGEPKPKAAVATAFKPSAAPASAPAGKRVLAFDGISHPCTKLAVLNISDKRGPAPLVRVYSAAPRREPQAADLRRWTKPQVVEIEWGFEDKAPQAAVEGRLEAFWGEILRIEPLEEGNGLRTLDVDRWREEVVPGPKRRGLRVTVAGPAGIKQRSQEAAISLRTNKGGMAFSMTDLESGPILVPSVGMYVVKAGGVSARQFQQELAAKNLKTMRQRLRERQPEQSYAEAMKAVFGDTPLPAFPEPPYTSPMRIDVPEKQLVSQWRLGAWHLKRHSRKVDPRNLFRGLTCNGDWEPDANIYEVNIWPPRNGAGTVIGAETYKILMALDMLGVHDVAEGGLNFWLKARKHATGNFHGMGNPRVNYFSDFDGLLLLYWYDMKHTEGHADILRAAALHARMTGDRDWVRAVAPKLKKACEFILRQRKSWDPAVPPGTWVYGLQGPLSAGDGADLAWYYLQDKTMCVAVMQVAQVLADNGIEGAADLAREAEAYRMDIRAAAELSIARTPVIRVADGTYRRFIPAAPYLRKFSGFDVLAGALRFGRDGIFAFDEPIMQEMLDVIEESISRVFETGGYGSQVGHECHWKLYLLSDDVPLFLRAMYNGYVANIRPWQDDNIGSWPQKSGYSFWGGQLRGGSVEGRPASYVFSEHPRSADFEKVFEEAAFIERVRNMLVMEIGDALWLAKATPRAWLEQGKKISVKNAPTYFGTLAYEIVSDVDNGKIVATIEMPARNPPASVILRLRHPKAAPLKSVTVNGKPWTAFNKDKETITVKGLTGTVAVTAQY
jgi:hypothetical protein